jgi:hypothetical protein
MFSQKVTNFTKSLMTIFERGIEENQKVPDLEIKILSDIYK